MTRPTPEIERMTDVVCTLREQITPHGPTVTIALGIDLLAIALAARPQSERERMLDEIPEMLRHLIEKIRIGHMPPLPGSPWFKLPPDDTPPGH